MLIGKTLTRGVGDIIANVGACRGASVVTSSAAEERIVIGELRLTVRIVCELTS